MNAKLREVPVRFHSDGGTLRLIARAAPGGEAKDAPESETIAASGVAYTGAVLHSFFGDVIADMDGMQPIPERGAALLYGHSQPIGVVRSVSKTDKGLEYSGEMVRALERSTEIAALAKNGFPWQLSIRAEPDVIEDVREGVTATVNGRTVTGPITIFRQWRLPEISVVELGLDGDTEATIAAHAGGGVRRRVLIASPTGGEMADTETATAPATVEELRASSPDLVAAIEAEARNAGVSAERSRITEIIDATRQAIVAEDAKEGEENVEAQALTVVASAVADGAEAKTLMASLLKLSRAAVKATATPQETRRALTSSAGNVESGKEAARGRSSGLGDKQQIVAAAKQEWSTMPAAERAKFGDQDIYIGAQLMAAQGKE